MAPQLDDRRSEPTGTWLVGHDGSTSAHHAAEWALTQAQRHNVDIVLARSWEIPALEVPVPVDELEQFAPRAVSDDADELVARAADAGVLVTQRMLRGAATNALIDESEAAHLLVLGSRGLGGFRRLLLGSVSSQCATHAVVPTIVVPAAAPADVPLRRVVVGVDGSDRSLAALDWATAFAPDDCEITVAGAWNISRSGYVAVSQHYTNELEAARQRFAEMLDQRDARAGSRPVDRHFVFADPAPALLDASRDADLLVVGQRGHSGLSAAILGSVTTHVLHHSTVPVAVVPSDT